MQCGATREFEDESILVSLPFSELLTPAFTPHWPTRPRAILSTQRAFSKGGSGLLIVSDLPLELEMLRRKLLSRSPFLPTRAALHAEHGLGTDTSGPSSPSSATLQIVWEDPNGPLIALGGGVVGGSEKSGRAATASTPPCATTDASASSLQQKSTLRLEIETLGGAWVAICTGVAAACDSWLQQSNDPVGEPQSLGILSKALLQARQAKARLIYYGRPLPSTNTPPSLLMGEGGPSGSGKTTWQEWHKDYGLFTAVSSPMYWEEGEGEGAREVAPPPSDGGLHVLCHKGVVHHMDVPAGCVGVQVGEAAQIMSSGCLAATPHCVRRPHLLTPQWSRASFVVFCQPPAHEPLRPGAGGGTAEGVFGGGCDPHLLAGVLPSLSRRWPGPQGIDSPCTFAEFGKATVKAYFGKAGTQKGLGGKN